MVADLKTIMIVDDFEEDRFFTCRELRKMNPDLDFREFSHGEQALSFLRSPERPKIDLVLVDINMPGMDGFQFAQAYLELYPELRGSAPVLVASSSLNPADRDYAAEHPGVAGFITKPISRKDLEAVMSEIKQ